jgi:predicted XRE-type DNA-binding protein
MARQRVTESSGNPFADLGLADAEELDLKACLVMKLADVMRRRRLSQTATAALTGISQPDLSKILRGRLRDISVDRIMRALTRLDTEIDISVRHRGEPVGETIHLHPVGA